MTPHTPTPSKPDPNHHPASWQALTVPLPAGETHLLAPLRRIAAANLVSWDVPQIVTDDVLLALTELATNGLQHTAGPIRVHLLGHVTSTYLQVEDTSSDQPQRTSAGFPAERSGGFGLEIIETLASKTFSRIRPGRGKIITAKFNH